MANQERDPATTGWDTLEQRISRLVLEERRHRQYSNPRQDH
jgi:hypothetical protein